MARVPGCEPRRRRGGSSLAEYWVLLVSGPWANTRTGEPRAATSQNRGMRISQGKVVGGRVIVKGEALSEGAICSMLAAC